MYDPSLGIMLQADTVIPNGPATQSMNRYSYVFNNPLSYTDPTGHSPEDDNFNFRYTYPNGDYFEGELTPEQFQEAMEQQVENGSVSLGVAGVENAAFSNESGSSNLPISSYGDAETDRMMATTNGLSSKDHLGHGRSQVHDVLEVPVAVAEALTEPDVTTIAAVVAAPIVVAGKINNARKAVKAVGTNAEKKVENVVNTQIPI